nr:MAG TPA: hypothetical protein [Ackermannviridae sp.]
MCYPLLLPELQKQQPVKDSYIQCPELPFSA